jgi:hypothetical protein
MQEVSRKKFEQKCNEGVWEVMFEPNNFGTCEVRVNRTGKRLVVRVVN